MENKKKGHYSVLELININEMNERIEYDHNRRCEKRKLYAAFSRYIECLEKKLENEKDFYKKILIKLKIIKVKHEQKKYYEISILEQAEYSLMRLDRLEKETKETTSSLVKKKKKMYKK